MINKKDNPETNNQEFMIEDLSVNQDQAATVKGGPIYMNFKGISGHVSS